MSIRVFISYRREDQRALASWLHDKLAGELDSAEVFLDTKTVKAGSPFPDYVRRALESATVYAILIGPRWNPMLADGSRRLSEPADWVRQEVALALQHTANDSRRLVLPLLCEEATMPLPSELPDCMGALTSLQAFPLSSRDYVVAMHAVVERVVERIDELDTTPPEERWVTERLRSYLQRLGSGHIAQIGNSMKRRFKQVNAAPESPRALARAIYRVGPEALEYLVGLGTPLEQMESFLDLLATNWIKPEEAAKLRRVFSDAQEGRRLAIECEYRDFTPDETMLKASGTEHGWESMTVKPSDGKAEIIQQIHEELLSRLNMSLRPATTRAPEETLSDADRVMAERKEILAKLSERCAEEGWDRLPFVLHATPQMARDPTLFDRVQEAFPPLHILIATHDVDELRGRISRLAPDVITPSDSEEEERHAYDAYANAHEIIDRAARRKHK